MRDGRRLSTCYYEAGHALARWYFGHFTDKAVVITVADVKAGRWAEGRRGPGIGNEGFVDGYGIHNVWKSVDHIRADPERLRQEEIARDQTLIVLHAGVAAEAAYRRATAELCWELSGSGDRQEIDRILSAWFSDLDKWISADATAWRRAVTLVRSKPGAAAVRAMAGALMGRGEIDGDEIASICRGAYGDGETGFMEWDAHWPPKLADIRNGVIHETKLQVAA